MFELNNWYEYQLKGYRKKTIGKCISISSRFITFHIGFENRPKVDTVVDIQNMVELSTIKTYRHVLNRNIETVTKGNKETYIDIEK